jgi:Nitroreductase
MSGILSDLFEKNEGPGVEAPPPIDAKEFFKVIESRRSVRKYTSKQIPQEHMMQILEAGVLAPSSSNLQQWEFYWVKSPEKRKAIDEAFLGQPAVVTAAEVIVAVARTGTWKAHAQEMLAVFRKSDPPAPKSVMLYYSKIVPLAYTVGWFGIIGFFKKIVLFLRGLTTPTPRECASVEDLRIWAVKSTALACENIMLSARALGYDSCPMEGMDSSRIKSILNLPSDAVVVMGISLGERDPQGVYGKQFRFPSERFIKKV